MKRIALAIVGLMLIAVPGLAGEYLMNDTGQTVYGLQVTFSEPVSITSFGDVLTSIIPSGESTEFTFSEGELEAWGGHWFNWEPTIVTLESHKWLDAEELVPLLEEHEPVVGESIEVVMKSGSGEQLLLTCLRRMSDRSIPFFVEYMVEEAANGLEISWDFSQFEDSDLDGQFRNDEDATGLHVIHVYNTNRTPFTVTIRATDSEGTDYQGEDGISFVIRAGDEVLLGATDAYERAGIGKITSWLSRPGDPSDSNWVVHTDENGAWLVPEYPGICEIQVVAGDKAAATQLFVFNPMPDFLEIKGVAFNSATRPYTELGNVQRHLACLRSLGFNWLEITYATLYEIESNSFAIIDTRYGPYEAESQPGDIPYYEKTAQVINMAQDAGFEVSLNLHLWDRAGQSRWLIAPTSTFFHGETGYFSFVEEGIRLANETSVELLVANNELGSLARKEARPFLEEEIRFLADSLTASDYSFSNFFDPGGYPSGKPYPRPWDDEYGTPLNLLQSIGFSSYRGIASTRFSGVAEMQSRFTSQQIDNYSLTRAASEDNDLHVFISELGYPNANGGATENYWQIDGGLQDSEEQRRAVAATLRAIYDLIRTGGTYFDGIFWWGWVVDTDEALAHNLSTSFRFNARPRWPSLDEIYCFWNAAPQKVVEYPILYRRFGAATYLDPLLDVEAVSGYEDSRIRFCQGFESFPPTGPVVSSYGILASNVGLSTLSAEPDHEVYADGETSLRLEYINRSGEGGEALIYPQLNLPHSAFTTNDFLSLSIRRSDPNLGIAWVIHDSYEHNGDTFVQRIPVSATSDWETFVLHVGAFSKGCTGEETDTADMLGRSRLDASNVAVLVYSIDGSPIVGTIWIDSVGLGR